MAFKALTLDEITLVGSGIVERRAGILELKSSRNERRDLPGMRRNDDRNKMGGSDNMSELGDTEEGGRMVEK